MSVYACIYLYCTELQSTATHPGRCSQCIWHSCNEVVSLVPAQDMKRRLNLNLLQDYKCGCHAWMCTSLALSVIWYLGRPAYEYERGPHQRVLMTRTENRRSRAIAQFYVPENWLADCPARLKYVVLSIPSTFPAWHPLLPISVHVSKVHTVLHDDGYPRSDIVEDVFCLRFV